MGSYLKEGREEREKRENESKDLVLQTPEEIRQGLPKGEGTISELCEVAWRMSFTFLSNRFKMARN